jgi:hypothetical protein
MLNPDRERTLNEFLDGELSPEAARSFQEELGADPALQAEERGLRGLIDEAAQLPNEIAPERDLWPGVAARLGRIRPATHRGRPRSTAVKGTLAVAAAAVIFLGGIYYGRMIKTPDQTTVGGPGSGPPAALEAPMAELASAQREYEQVRAALHAALAGSRDWIEPETARVIDQNLVVIANAIHDIEVALQNDPNNQRLIRSLVATYDQEVHLLRQATRLATLDSAKEEA